MTERATAVERAREIIEAAVDRLRALLSDVPAGGEPLVRVYRDGELLSQLRATPPGAGVAGVGYTVEVVPADTEGGEDRRGGIDPVRLPAGPDHVGESDVAPRTIEDRSHLLTIDDGMDDVAPEPSERRSGERRTWKDGRFDNRGGHLHAGTVERSGLDRRAEPSEQGTGDAREVVARIIQDVWNGPPGQSSHVIADRILSALSSEGERDDEAFALGQSCGSYDQDGKFAEAAGKMAEMGYDRATLDMLLEHVMEAQEMRAPSQDVEPVAWSLQWTCGHHETWLEDPDGRIKATCSHNCPDSEFEQVVPLYTSPPDAQQLVEALQPYARIKLHKKTLGAIHAAVIEATGDGPLADVVAIALGHDTIRARAALTSGERMTARRLASQV